MTTNLAMRLMDSWNALTQRCEAPASAMAAVFDQLVAAYGEPGRFYHSLVHIADVLDMLGTHRNEAKQPDTLDLAAWFHDVVYDARAKDNEERSAEVAVDALRRLRLPAPPIGRVAALIRMTREHRCEPADTDAQLLLDADLAILGALPEQYKDYARAIRQEYGWVPEADYRAGRCAVLRRFLDRPRIYHTESIFGARELIARQNLAAEIVELS